jgi:uncharacterized membrane protein
MEQTRIVRAKALHRLALAALFGVIVGCLIAATGMRRFAILAGWDAAAVLMVASTLITVLRFDAISTRAHALREDPGRAAADISLTAASVASLVGVGFLIFQAGDANGVTKTVDITLGLFSVVAAWATIHTLYMLKYARLYYGTPEGGIGFNGRQAPQYSDFAYLAFTIGMTFQVSDTNLETTELRATALKQALLSYLFGTVIIAITINTLASLSK